MNLQHDLTGQDPHYIELWFINHLISKLLELQHPLGILNKTLGSQGRGVYSTVVMVGLKSADWFTPGGIVRYWGLWYWGPSVPANITWGYPHTGWAWPSHQTGTDPWQSGKPSSIQVSALRQKAMWMCSSMMLKWKVPTRARFFKARLS